MWWKWELWRHCCEILRRVDDMEIWEFVEMEMFQSYDSTYNSFNKDEIIHSEVVMVSTYP